MATGGGAKAFDLAARPVYEGSADAWEVGRGSVGRQAAVAAPAGLTPSMVEAAWRVFDPWLDCQTDYDPDYGPHEVYVSRRDFEVLLAEMWRAMDAARSAEAARRKEE